MTVVKVIDRRKLKWYEQRYLPAEVQGLALTFRELFRPDITLQYPEERQHLHDDYRGAPALVMDQDGREKCVSCQLCEFICPPRAIVIEPGEIPPGDPDAHVEKAQREFFIDMLRCIYCGFCEEVCPEDAIVMTGEYELSGASRAELVHNKARLYERVGRRTDPIKKWEDK